MHNIKCKKVNEISENCQVGESELSYQCRKGYKFANNQGNILNKIEWI